MYNSFPRISSSIFSRTASTVLILVTVTVCFDRLAVPSIAQGNGVREAAFSKACQGVRDAIAVRNFALAKQKLQEAEKNRTSVVSQNRHTRLVMIVNYLENFWSVLRDGMARLDAPSEMMIGSTRGMIVDSSRNHIVLRGAGKRYEYTWQQMGRNIALAISERTFTNTPESKVAVGTFLVFDSRGDKESGLRLWREATKGGIPNIDMMIDEAEGRPTLGGGNNTGTSGDNNGGDNSGDGNNSGGGNSGGNNGGGNNGGGPDLENGLPVPTDATSLSKARVSIRELLKPQYEAATVKYKQAELAEFLLSLPDRSDKVRDNPFLHYVAFREARDMAVKAGNMEICFEAIDKLDAIFAIDVIHEKKLVIESLTDIIRTTRSLSDLAFAAIRVAIEANESKHKDARKLAELALETARKSKNVKYMQGAAEVLRKISGGR